MYYSDNEDSVQLKILDSFITCNTTANWTEVLLAVQNVKSYRAGSIYMENSLQGVFS
jgi:hypothetical protein